MVILEECILDVPTKTEINNIKARVRELLKQSKSLFRRLKDLEGTYENKTEVIDKFQDYTYKYNKLSYFNSMMYACYVIVDPEIFKANYSKIIKYLRDNNELSECEGHSKDCIFFSERHALRWIMAYRWTKQHYYLKLVGVL